MNYLEAFRNMKKDGYAPPSVVLKNAGHKGVGVFAARDFDTGEAVEFCHSIILEWQGKYQRDAMIGKYCYSIPCHCSPGPQKPPCELNCPKNGNRWIMPMGYGSCYNSSDSQQDANARWLVLVEEFLLVVEAVKKIKAGEEILTWFGDGYYDFWCKKNQPHEFAISNQKAD